MGIPRLKSSYIQNQHPNRRIQQELINSIIQGFKFIFGIISFPNLIEFGIKCNNKPGVAIYDFCFLQLFTFSTLYHGFQHAQVKRVFEIIDHISIYFLIADTYTPSLLIYIDNSFSITQLVILWKLTVLGIIFKIFFTGRWNILSTVIYIFKGCIMIFGGSTFS